MKDINDAISAAELLQDKIGTPLVLIDLLAAAKAVRDENIDLANKVQRARYALDEHDAVVGKLSDENVELKQAVEALTARIGALRPKYDAKCELSERLRDELEGKEGEIECWKTAAEKHDKNAQRLAREFNEAQDGWNKAIETVKSQNDLIAALSQAYCRLKFGEAL